MEPLAVIALGFVLGVRHATDPDHVVAGSQLSLGIAAALLFLAALSSLRIQPRSDTTT